jgi:hypothetical protein
MSNEPAKTAHNRFMGAVCITVGIFVYTLLNDGNFKGSDTDKQDSLILNSIEAIARDPVLATPPSRN